MEKLAALPNLIYTDGREIVLFHGGVRDSAARVDGGESKKLRGLLERLLRWQLQAPSTPRALAEFIAPLCRLIRGDVADALGRENSAIGALAAEWRDHFFPEVTNAQFADAYAQTVTYALPLAQLDGMQTGKIREAVDKLKDRNNLLSRALAILCQDEAR